MGCTWKRNAGSAFVCLLLAPSFGPIPILAQEQVAGPDPVLNLVENAERWLPEGIVMVEGDILMTREEFEARRSGEARKGGAYEVNWWPSGYVPYNFFTTSTATARQSIVTGLIFNDAVPPTIEPVNPVATDLSRIGVLVGDYLVLSGTAGNDNTMSTEYYVQAVASNQITLGGSDSLVNETTLGDVTVGAHELAHALKQNHEQSRPDRDAFVQINDANISQTACGGTCNHNFDVSGFAYPTAPHAVYDSDSVMHYPADAFSANRLPTITVLPPWDSTPENWPANIGQRTHLSFWDQKVMSLLYPFADMEFLWAESSATANGGFRNPWKTLSDAVLNVPTGGKLVVLYPDVYDANGIYDNTMTIDAPTGGVLFR